MEEEDEDEEGEDEDDEEVHTMETPDTFEQVCVCNTSFSNTLKLSLY